MSDESCNCGCATKPENDTSECTCGCGTKDTGKK